MRKITCMAMVVVLFSPVALGDVVTFELGYQFNATGTPPTGPTPWLRATFDDGGTPGSVDLLLETPNLVDAESVFDWYFNLDPALDPTALAFSAPIKTGLFADPVINTGVDAYMADGDGRYDIWFDFATADGGANRFGVGDSLEYTITGIPTLVASSFNFLSLDMGGYGPFYTVGHIAAIAPSNTSGWITVPEPATAVLMLGALALLRRRR